jgi:hypothetical protein
MARRDLPPAKLFFGALPLRKRAKPPFGQVLRRVEGPNGGQSNSQLPPMDGGTNNTQAVKASFIAANDAGRRMATSHRLLTTTRVWPEVASV